jgi:hypothetical protein
MTLAEYFAQNRYQAKYSLGDRIIGKWNKIPFVGTVGNDTLINEEEGPRISVHLDLPIKYEDVVHNFIIVKHKDVKRLPSIELEETNDKSTNRKTSSKKPVLDSNGRKRKSG